MTETHIRGGCHCRAVRFEATLDPSAAITCNCSHCSAKGFVLAFAPRSALLITSGAELLTEYRFNRKAIAHMFCRICGVQPFGFGTGPDGQESAAINLRCADDIDIATLTPQAFDGRSL